MLHGERFASTRLARSVRESIPREAVPAVGRVRFWRREPLTLPQKSAPPDEGILVRGRAAV